MENNDSQSSQVLEGDERPSGSGDPQLDEVVEVSVAKDLPEPIADEYAATRGACVDHPAFGPVCPVRWCRFHLDSQDKRTWKHMAVRRCEGDDTCAIRLATRGPATLEEVAVRLGLTRERVRQIEAKAMINLTRGLVRMELVGREEISRERRLVARISTEVVARVMTGTSS